MLRIGQCMSMASHISLQSLPSELGFLAGKAPRADAARRLWEALDSEPLSPEEPG